MACRHEHRDARGCLDCRKQFQVLADVLFDTSEHFDLSNYWNTHNACSFIELCKNRNCQTVYERLLLFFSLMERCGLIDDDVFEEKIDAIMTNVIKQCKRLLDH